MLRKKLVALLGRDIQHRQTLQLTIHNFHIRQPLLKPNLTTEGDDLLTQIFYNFDQLERADMRMRINQNLCRRAGFDKLLHHLAPQMARVFDLTVELTI